jgi:hypothetical protein
MCTDLANDAAPANAAQATLHPKAFKRWLEYCKCTEIDEANPGQIVVMLRKGATVNAGAIQFTPNWHITAMTDRMKTVCNNFHFKIEATKACAHYWHYVLYYHPTNATWHWVGDANPNIPGRNDAGGGSANSVELLDGNRALVDNAAATNGLANTVNRAVQGRMVAALKRLTDDGVIFLKNGVWQ